MAATYRVGEIVERDEWGNDYGNFAGYKLRLEGPDGPVNQIVALNQKLQDGQERSPIQVGQELFGEIDTSGARPKFKKLKPEQGGGAAPPGGSRAGGARDDDYPSPEFWAAKDRAIQRQHSQDMALRLIDATGDAREMDLANDSVTPAYLNNIVRRLADWFDRDVNAAARWPDDSVRGRQERPSGEQGDGAQVVAEQTAPEANPVVAHGPAVPEDHPTSDDDIPF